VVCVRGSTAATSGPSRRPALLRSNSTVCTLYCASTERRHRRRLEPLPGDRHDVAGKQLSSTTPAKLTSFRAVKTIGGAAPACGLGARHRPRRHDEQQEAHCRDRGVDDDQPLRQRHLLPVVVEIEHGAADRGDDQQ
jgi:hypothetical protein